jgi:hypothetical protein
MVIYLHLVSENRRFLFFGDLLDAFRQIRGEPEATAGDLAAAVESGDIEYLEFVHQDRRDPDLNELPF